MNKNAETVITQVIVYLNNKKNIGVPSEEDIKKCIEIYSMLTPLTDDENKEVTTEVFSRLNVRMDVGSVIKEDNHKPWYMNAKAENMDEKYWRRYSNYLITEKGFAPEAVNAIDRATDKIMDLFGNPQDANPFSRRGLVIGDVQSGKTSTYTALINKAADSGYKVIILLTGTIEKLRQQTQTRLDEGFVGLDSAAFVGLDNNGTSRERQRIEVGVGKLDGSFSACSLTSTSGDFSQKVAQNLNITIKNFSNPVILVLKKNKSVLTKLERWFRLYNSTTGTIVAPMLLIDDEADNASVNTKKDEENPTAINACIRKLLKLFTHSTYVAFTATPYANIFINPDTDDEMLKDDLFPRDFIYTLDAPTNYIGANSIFNDNGKCHYMLRNNNDCEKFVPENHKKDVEPSGLPISLKEAICSFFIANVIRDLRGQENTHRSMLINISRFIDVQEKISEIIDGFVRLCLIEYKNYGKSFNATETHGLLKFTKNVYEKYYENLDYSDKGEMFTWNEVQSHLAKSCTPIVVRTVNGMNSKRNLNYDENSEFGLRIIAVGGFSLSRGLTLEGLSTSYFYRNSKMYDTLMQMGRWFGYRKGYEDLCQVWMSEKSQEWYKYITEAQEDLKHEIKKMMNANRTPKEFGLGVRNDISSLLVTAVNKMRNSADYDLHISLCGNVVETRYLILDEEKQKVNNKVIHDWLTKVLKDGYYFTTVKEVNGKLYDLDQKKHKQILSIDSHYIKELLSDFEVSKYNFDFQPENIIDMIKNDTSNIFEKWDLIIANNDKNDIQNIAEDVSIGPITRSFAIDDAKKYIQMSGSKSRLGSVNYAKGGLTKEEVEEIEKRAKLNKALTEDSKSFNQNDYFNTGYKRNPLIVIYPITLTKNKINIEHPELIELFKDLVFGLAVGFPDIDGKGKVTYSYKINKIKWKEIMEISDDYEEEVLDEDD